MPCDRCGFENPAGFRFCGACGARLRRQEELGHAQERKIISALFCDVVDSTRQAENLDPEAVHRVLAPYFDRVRSELTRLGETVEKFIGDAVCGFFGLLARTATTPSEPFVPRWQLSSGSPTATRVTWEPSSTSGWAWRPERRSWRLAPSPEPERQRRGATSRTPLSEFRPRRPLTASSSTRRRTVTRHVIDYGEAEPVQAKGKTEPILVWRALAPRARRGVGLSHADREPFVGRVDDLRRLQESLDRVSRDRAPELVTLVGAPGIGKTRLVFELFRCLELSPSVVLWRQARSSPYGDGFTFWALGEIVKAQAGILETDGSRGRLGQARSSRSRGRVRARRCRRDRG